MPNDSSLSRLHFGLEIEGRALAWYQRRYPRAVLVARNFRTRRGELDLVFELPGRRSDALELVFVEVRARLEGSWQGGIESVGPLKLARLRQAIGVFLARYRGRAKSVRLDILAWDGREWEHRENVWT